MVGDGDLGGQWCGLQPISCKGAGLLKRADRGKLRCGDEVTVVLGVTCLLHVLLRAGLSRERISSASSQKSGIATSAACPPVEGLTVAGLVLEVWLEVAGCVSP